MTLHQKAEKATEISNNVEESREQGRQVELAGSGHHSSYLLRTNKTSYQIKANATGVAPGTGVGTGAGLNGKVRVASAECRVPSAINRIPWPILTRGQSVLSSTS